MKIDNYEYSEEYEKEVEGIAGKLNFSDTKIIAGFNNKVADYKRQHRTKKILTRVLSIAATVVVAVSSVAVYNGYIGRNASIGTQKEAQNMFNIKVYAADNDSEPVVLEEGMSVQIQDTIDVRYSSASSTGDVTIIGELPLLCEGADIESITYQFEDGETGFWQDYVLSEEDEETFKELMAEDEITLETDLFAPDNKIEQRISFLKQRNLLTSFDTKPAEDGRYHFTQYIGNEMIVAYEEQAEKTFYIESRWLGDNALRENSYYSNKDVMEGMSEYVNGRILCVTANMKDGSKYTQRLGLKSELYDALGEKAMRIYITSAQ